MKKHFSSVKNYNCFGWSLHNGCYCFMFFRLAQNVYVERQTCTKGEDTEKLTFSVFFAFLLHASQAPDHFVLT